MTTDSGRTKLVRERMGRTGEPFVTANRHVIAARPIAAARAEEQQAEVAIRGALG